MSATQTPVQDQLLWDVGAAAAALAIGERTLKEWQADGRLPAGAVVRLGKRRLFSPDVLREWVRQGCPPPAGKGRGR